VGSSGVGKSTMVNALLGTPAQATREVREGDSRGRHTTTTREPFLLPKGWLLIDTPGMRELEVWGAEGTAEAAFDDVASFAAACRFRDCAHTGEPGCAVARALEDGLLDPDRLASLCKLRRETDAQALKRRDRMRQRAYRQIEGRKW
jgi:ribosome biogenesis GTPase